MANRKLKKLKDAKAKLSQKKKAVMAKHKSKPTAATKKQLEKLKSDSKKANDTLSDFNEEMAKVHHKTSGMSYLIKHTEAEFKLIEQYRKKQQKLEAQKAKKKAKKKTK